MAMRGYRELLDPLVEGSISYTAHDSIQGQQMQTAARGGRFAIDLVASEETQTGSPSVRRERARVSLIAYGTSLRLWAT
jgi:hypothetical protein